MASLSRPLPVLLVNSELAKATIINTQTGVGYPVMYNPEELKLEQGNTYAEVGIPGLNAPPVQYVRGKNRALSGELFFDTYENKRDVRDLTGPIVALLEPTPQTKAPPLLLFAFGTIQFRCVLVDAGQRFTMFLRDGTPVRATLSVRLQEYVEVDVQITSGLFFGSPTVSGAVNAIPGVPAAAQAVLGPGAVVHVVAEGETLSSIAGAYLGDPGAWRRIADANTVADPVRPAVGTTLIIPKADARGEVTP